MKEYYYRLKIIYKGKNNPYIIEIEPIEEEELKYGVEIDDKHINPDSNTINVRLKDRYNEFQLKFIKEVLLYKIDSNTKEIIESDIYWSNKK